MAYDRTRLTDEEVRAFLNEAPGWRLEAGELVKVFAFTSFREAIGFVNRLAEEAERANHHPDLDIRYRKVTVRLMTHDAGGLTFRDPQLARVADACATQEG